jgi:hypothetical protein|eukprot:COSAG06_NODE_1153_length_10481_cov_1445.985070_5_plen_307_part_00
MQERQTLSLSLSVAMPAEQQSNGVIRAVMNCETNVGDHTFNRALLEGWDLNTFFNEKSSKLKGRTASFCMERSGFSEGGANDQGLLMFLPNQTWGQPGFYTHQMVAATWQPNALSWSTDAQQPLLWQSYIKARSQGWWHRAGFFAPGAELMPPTNLTVANCRSRCRESKDCDAFSFQSRGAVSEAATVLCRTLTSVAGLKFTSVPHKQQLEGRVSAQRSDDGKKIVVRLVNWGEEDETVMLNVAGVVLAPTVRVTRYHSDDLAAVNTPAHPRGVVPNPPETVARASLQRLSLPASTYMVVEAAAAA